MSSEDSKEVSGSVPSIRAKTVHLDKTGKVIGDIAHEILAIEAGAYFEGRVQSLESVDPGWAAKLARA